MLIEAESAETTTPWLQTLGRAALVRRHPCTASKAPVLLSLHGMKGDAMLDSSEQPVAYCCELHAHISHFMTLPVTPDQLL